MLKPQAGTCRRAWVALPCPALGGVAFSRVLLLQAESTSPGT